MKKLWTKYRISTAIDSGKSPSPSLQKQIGQCSELKRFARNIQQLEDALRNTGPAQETPPNLHSSIMSAVRASEQPSVQPLSLSVLLLRWLPAPAVAALLVWTAIHFWPATTDANTHAATFSSAISSLEKGMALPHTASSSLMSPLADEWNRLNQDAAQAKAFLLASFP